jgi:DNA-binding MarR family transcriptional regulator
VAVKQSRGAHEQLAGELQSPRLQQVLAHFAEAGSPVRVVATSAVFRANKIIMSRMDAALGPLEMTSARYEILGLLYNSDAGRLSLGELGRITLSHPATMTYTIDTMEKRRLLRRQPDPGDRRAVLAEITPDGRSLFEQANTLLDAIDWGIGDLAESDAASVAILLSGLS